jgi:hypothetical protein
VDGVWSTSQLTAFANLRNATFPRRHWRYNSVAYTMPFLFLSRPTTKINLGERMNNAQGSSRAPLGRLMGVTRFKRSPASNRAYMTRRRPRRGISGRCLRFLRDPGSAPAAAEQAERPNLVIEAIINGGVVYTYHEDSGLPPVGLVTGRACLIRIPGLKGASSACFAWLGTPPRWPLRYAITESESVGFP